MYLTPHLWYGLIRFVFKPRVTLYKFQDSKYLHTLKTHGNVHGTNDFTAFGYNKAENQNSALAFFLPDRNITIFVVKRVLQKHSVVIFGLVWKAKFENSIFGSRLCSIVVYACSCLKYDNYAAQYVLEWSYWFQIKAYWSRILREFKLVNDYS